jgi:putative Mn2+ efflux pump MntP
MMVLLLGLALGLDSFRTSAALGTLRPRLAGQFRTALAFGICDGVAPLLGLSLGSRLVTALAPWAGALGPILLAGFGLYQLAVPRGAEGSRGEGQGIGPWMTLGLPLLLSLDNLVAGFGLGLMRVPVVPSALAIGALSGLLSLAGFRLGTLIGGSLPAHAGRIGGVALVVLSIASAFDLF